MNNVLYSDIQIGARILWSTLVPRHNIQTLQENHTHFVASLLLISFFLHTYQTKFHTNNDEDETLWEN
jgi:hypothetical protein